MLLNIKSSFILKQLFSYLGKREILKIVKYNQRLFNRLNINLIDYKIFSGRFLIFEENGKAKEFNCCSDEDNNLLYEGYYINGKKNGRGKEFLGNLLLFEGE